VSVFKCFSALWVSILVYSFLSAFFGASSFSSVEAVFAEKDRLVENLEDLRMINQELSGSLAALQYDSDTIAVYARELGYGTRNERFVRIVGVPAAAKKSLSAGRQILPVFPQFVPDKTIHIISLAAGLITLLLLFVFGHKKRKIEIN
jgi:cell division protein FtsB